MKAKAILYILIGSSLMFALLFAGNYIRSASRSTLAVHSIGYGGDSFGFVIDGLLGLLTIGLGVLFLASAACVLFMFVVCLYSLGEWIMEKLL